MRSPVVVAGMATVMGTGATVRLHVENHRSCPLSWREHQHDALFGWLERRLVEAGVLT